MKTRRPKPSVYVKHIRHKAEPNVLTCAVLAQFPASNVLGLGLTTRATDSNADLYLYARVKEDSHVFSRATSINVLYTSKHIRKAADLEN